MDGNGVEAFLYCQIEGAVSDDTLARQQSTDLFFFSKVNVVPLPLTMRKMLHLSVSSFVQ